MAEETPPATTAFNAGLSSLKRLHEQLELCSAISQNCFLGRYNIEALKLYRITVINVFYEISPKLTQEEKTKIKKMFRHMSTLRKVIFRKNTEEDGFINQLNPAAFIEHWEWLGNVEVALRGLADKRGMLIPNKPGSRDSIADME